MLLAASKLVRFVELVASLELSLSESEPLALLLDLEFCSRDVSLRGFFFLFLECLDFSKIKRGGDESEDGMCMCSF